MNHMFFNTSYIMYLILWFQIILNANDKKMEIIYSKLNMFRLMKPGTELFDKDDVSMTVEFPFSLTEEIINTLIKKHDKSKGY